MGEEHVGHQGSRVTDPVSDLAIRPLPLAMLPLPPFPVLPLLGLPTPTRLHLLPLELILVCLLPLTSGKHFDRV